MAARERAGKTGTDAGFLPAEQSASKSNEGSSATENRIAETARCAATLEIPFEPILISMGTVGGPQVRKNCKKAVAGDRATTTCARGGRVLKRKRLDGFGLRSSVHG